MTRFFALGPILLLIFIAGALFLGGIAVAIVLIAGAASKSKKKTPEAERPLETEAEIEMKKTLGETLRAYRIERNMTQEFVAESLGVSRQAVSKWESGASDPSTSNLLAIARLYGVSAGELLEAEKIKS